MDLIKKLGVITNNISYMWIIIVLISILLNYIDNTSTSRISFIYNLNTITINLAWFITFLADIKYYLFFAIVNLQTKLYASRWIRLILLPLLYIGVGTAFLLLDFNDGSSIGFYNNFLIATIVIGCLHLIIEDILFYKKIQKL